MRIDRLDIQNFRKFSSLTLNLDPQFTLLVGNNGSGKTTLLHALAVCFGVWFDALKEKVVTLPYKTIEPRDVRLELVKNTTVAQFQERLPVWVKAVGHIREKEITWGQKLETSYSHWQSDADNAKEALAQIANDASSNYPVLAFYRVTRAALPTQSGIENPLTPSLRWDAYKHCFDQRIDFAELRRWFYREVAAVGASGGHKRPGYEVVRRAVFDCVPGAEDLWFDVDRADIVCSINGQAQPLSNLSDGQRMLLAMVADIAVKAVTLNTHLLPSDNLDPEDELLPRVLQQTPGVVLIDELDVHLHPSWQRRVAADLKRTFPAIQFVCTSHSPQVIGEVPPEQIRIIDGDIVYSPEHSFGVDSSRILEEIMDTKSRTNEVDNLLTKLARQIDSDDFDGARATIHEATKSLGENDPEIVRARTLMAFVEHEA